MPAAVIFSGAGELDSLLPSLAELLVDAVASGASIGFLAPISFAGALEYWRSVREALGDSRLLLVWLDEATGKLAGTVQLDLALERTDCTAPKS